jgi:hypothetical protein
MDLDRLGAQALDDLAAVRRSNDGLLVDWLVEFALLVVVAAAVLLGMSQ